MNEHVDQHEELLIAALATEEDERSVLEAAGLSDCPVCRARIDQILGLQGQLEDLGGAERAEIEDALEGPGSTASKALVKELLSPLVHPPARTWSPRGIAAGFLVAVLGASVGYRVLRGPEEPDGLGERLSPQAVWNLQNDDYRLFRWNAELPPGATFTISIYDYDESSSANPDPIDVLEGWTETEWSPSTEQSKLWPERIRWEVRRNDFATGERASASASASRF